LATVSSVDSRVVMTYTSQNMEMSLSLRPLVMFIPNRLVNALLDGLGNLPIVWNDHLGLSVIGSIESDFL
jgi:hypothetical protein